MQGTTGASIPTPTAADRSALRTARIQHFIGRTVVYLLLAVAAIIFALPFYWVLIASFKTAAELRELPPTWWPQSFTLANYGEVWSATFARYFVNSFIYSGGSTLVVLFTSSLIGYVLVKDPSRLGNLLFWFILAASMVPFVTYLLPLFNTLLRLQQWTGITLINTYWGMILPWVVFPFGVFLMRQAMFSIPSDLLDAARMDGATEFQIYPITVGLVEFVGQFFVEYHLFTTASVLAILPIFVIYLILQRFIIEGIATQGLKG
jgi:multiple sugar transport system permease protein